MSHAYHVQLRDAERDLEALVKQLSLLQPAVDEIHAHHYPGRIITNESKAKLKHEQDLRKRISEKQGTIRILKEKIILNQTENSHG